MFVLCRFDVRCNAVLPGFTVSPMTDVVPEKLRQKVNVSNLNKSLLESNIFKNAFEHCLFSSGCFAHLPPSWPNGIERNTCVCWRSEPRKIMSSRLTERI